MLEPSLDHQRGPVEPERGLKVLAEGEDREQDGRAFVTSPKSSVKGLASANVKRKIGNETTAIQTVV